MQCHNLGPIHILVGDNSRIHSQLLAKALTRDPRFIIVGSPASSEEFLEIASRTRLDVVIISVNLDDEPMGGMTLLRKFHERHPQNSGGHAAGLFQPRCCARCFSVRR